MQVKHLSPALTLLILLTPIITSSPFITSARAQSIRRSGHSYRPLTIYIVRHAEKANDRDDSPLAPRGKAYARGLASILNDQRITVVLTSDLRRARDTARPLIGLLKAKRRRFSWRTLHSDNPGMIERTLNGIKNGNTVLLVGRSNFVPELVTDLSGHDITTQRYLYHRLYQLVRQTGQKYAFRFTTAPAWTPIPRSA